MCALLFAIRQDAGTTPYCGLRRLLVENIASRFPDPMASHDVPTEGQWENIFVTLSSPRIAKRPTQNLLPKLQFKYSHSHKGYMIVNPRSVSTSSPSQAHRPFLLWRQCIVSDARVRWTTPRGRRFAVLGRRWTHVTNLLRLADTWHRRWGDPSFVRHCKLG